MTNYENQKRHWRNRAKQAAVKTLALAKRAKKNGNIKVALMAMKLYHQQIKDSL